MKAKIILYEHDGRWSMGYCGRPGIAWLIDQVGAFGPGHNTGWDRGNGWIGCSFDRAVLPIDTPPEFAEKVQALFVGGFDDCAGFDNESARAQGPALCAEIESVLPAPPLPLWWQGQARQK